MAHKDRDAASAPEEMVTLPRGEIEAMIKAGAEAAVAASRNTLGFTSPSASVEERVHAQLGTPVPSRECLKTMHQACFNPRNGARFTAVIVPSSKWREGRVVDLIAYTYPEDIEARARKAGKPIHRQQYGGSDPRDPGKQGLTNEFLQWRYEAYHLADRRAFVGESAQFLKSVADGEPVEWKPESTAREVGAAQTG